MSDIPQVLEEGKGPRETVREYQVRYCRRSKWIHGYTDHGEDGRRSSRVAKLCTGESPRPSKKSNETQKFTILYKTYRYRIV